ncbi:hypothetical protein [Ferriphaselus sp. R-1]|uniref:hypothetical protein n=1 Tax=Ferriphaselus sp. R-1 TaxID=1485544 RepID=UPI000556D329|nr:hypothetical protein [Ferriphaselus sp. R-1]
MNEEQAVLDFFAQEENLPLALSVTDLVDGIRQRLNNRFWANTHAALNELVAMHDLPWFCELTEDRNAEECLVGTYLQARSGQRVFLRPFMEQQLLGDSHRIYAGLMWNVSPSPEQAALPAVTALRDQLLTQGFKSNDNFLVWQWTSLYPRRKDFLLRLTERPDALMAEVMEWWQSILLEHAPALQAANSALNQSPPVATVSLDQLRSSLKKA